MALSSRQRISALHQGAQARRNSIRPCQSGALLGRLAARASRIANPRPRIDDKRSHDPRGAFFRLSNAAGSSIFAFRAIRWIDGKPTTITGVVLGQPGHDQIAAGLAAADAMIDRIAGHRAAPDLRQPTLSPLPAPGSH